MSLKPFLLIAFIFLVSNAFAQNPELHTKDKSALNHFKRANGFYRNYELLEAEKELKKAIRIDPEFLEAHLYLADIYIQAKREKEAMYKFQRVIEIDPTAYPNVFIDLGSLYFQNGEYQKSKDIYTQFTQIDSLSDNNSILAAKGIERADFALRAIENPVPFEPKNLGQEINSPYSEYFPSMTVDDQTILFTRAVPYRYAASNKQEDFFISEKIDGQWSNANGVGEPINTDNNEGAPSLSADGQILIFTACERYGEYGDNRIGYGSCDLFFSVKNGNEWSQPKNIGQPVNSYHWESQPSFSSDGKTLFFVRNIRNRTGEVEQDIYRTRIQNDGSWSVPQKLGPNINTPGREESVFIHPDGQTLYFSSDGHTGMGGLDIFMSQKDENGEWGEPINLGYPINTHNDENSILISSDGKYAYFASDRDGGYGGLDLYYFELPDEFRPKPITYLKGIVYDAETKQKLRAAFELIDVDNDSTIITSFSNDVTGEFLVALPSDKNYALNVQRDGYLFYSDNFSLKGFFSKLEPFLKDIPLQPIKIGERIVLRNIFFELDKYELQSESITELTKILDFLNKNKKLSVELSGHTDDQGSDEYNQELSEMRAKAVYEYLVLHGIDKNRMTFIGYGEEQPIESNENPEGRASNRRTEMKIIGI